ncbi:MAG: PIN domain-containing protein [Nitrospirae bacterium]|nr:PIN domain-containing protein [Nitrospirota bacterium]
MIEDGVIADTSVLIDFLKNTEPTAAMVETLIIEKRLFTTGIIVAELLQGVRSANEEAYVSELIGGIPIIELDSAIWLKAGKLSCSLRRKGVTLPLTDVAIATLCIEFNLSLFSLDNHFERIPGVSLYKS